MLFHSHKHLNNKLINSQISPVIIAMTIYVEILLSITFLCFIFFCYSKIWHSKEENGRKFSRFCYNQNWFHKKLARNSMVRTKLLPNWPIFGMLPGLIENSHDIHNFVTDCLRANGGTFRFVGPWFANMDMLVTSDPANVHYILSKHFSNFPKGPEFKAIFSVLGDGILNTDSVSWEKHRKMVMALVNRPEFQNLVVKTTHNKVENGLLPIFESFADNGRELDLQDIFHRLTFDCACGVVLGHDPCHLSVDLPDCALETAVGDVEEAILYRHLKPQFFWRLQRWLQIGKENKHLKGEEALDQFVSRCISSKREYIKTRTSQSVEYKDTDYDLLTGYLESCDGEMFVRDGMINLVMAGTHTISATLTWFFWLLSKNPFAENKILEEIITVLDPKKVGKRDLLKLSDIEEATKKMVYLHGAICEALRLYPGVPINHKHSLEKDVLPSGEIIEANTRVLLCFFSMGRMESIWGKDCLEFKPDRWITEQGGIKHEPTSKFTAFNTGPRACLGKNMSIVEMKIVVISILYNFCIRVVDGHVASPCSAAVLQMKDGLRVRITKRNK